MHVFFLFLDTCYLCYLTIYGFCIQDLIQSVHEHKPLVDKLNKTGSALTKLCKDEETDKLEVILESDNSRYNALRKILREHQIALEEALQATSQVSNMFFLCEFCYAINLFPIIFFASIMCYLLHLFVQYLRSYIVFFFNHIFNSISCRTYAFYVQYMIKMI